jgi:hypothetical protein
MQRVDTSERSEKQYYNSEGYLIKGRTMSSQDEQEQRDRRRNAACPQLNPEATENKEMELFARLTLGDSNIAPAKFQGNERDTHRTDQWISSFRAYAKLRSLSEPAQIQYFQLLMADEAANWLAALPEHIKNDLEMLTAEFEKRFSLTDLDRWKKASSLWSREQGTEETVDRYVSDIRNSARIVPITDENMVKFAIIRGLRPEIRLHVLQSSPESIDDVMKAARVAETAISASQPSTEVALLRKQVATLIGKLETKPTVAVIDTPEPTRKVTFAAAAKPTYERRAPSNGSRSSTPERNEEQRSDSHPRTYDDREERRRYNEPSRYYSDRAPRGRYNRNYDQNRQAPNQRQQQQYQQPSNQEHSYNASDRLGNDNPNRYANVQCYCCQAYGHIARSCAYNPRNGQNQPFPR